MAEISYKYRSKDFGELPVILDHMNIMINFLEDRVQAINNLEMTARQDLAELMLDARDLRVDLVQWCTGNDDREAKRLVYEYLHEHGSRMLVFQAIASE